MPQLFDIYIVTDWSAKNEPGPSEKKADSAKKDNIWIGEAQVNGDGIETTETYCRTRARAVEHLQERIAQHLKDGKRVLAGFDFAFGFPQGFAKLLTGKTGWQGVWQYLADNIQDDELNENNRFEVAAAINMKIDGPGPFWSLPRNQEIEGLTSTSPWKGVNELDFDGQTMSRLRNTDAGTKGVQSVWKLYGAGSVGGQTLTGIPAVWKLRNAPGIAEHAQIWPFEISMTKKAELAKKPLVVFAEAFPSTADATLRELERSHRNAPKDQLQVRALNMELHKADAEGKLFEWFFSATGIPADARKEEAAILKPFDAEAVAAITPKKSATVNTNEENTPEAVPESDPVADQKAKAAADREAKRKEKEAERERLKAEREAKMEERRKEQEAKRAEREKERAEKEKEKEEAKAKREAEKAAQKAEREAEKAKKQAEREKKKAKSKAQSKKEKEKEKAQKEKEKAEKRAKREEERKAKKAEREKAKAKKKNKKGKDASKDAKADKKASKAAKAKPAVEKKDSKAEKAKPVAEKKAKSKPAPKAKAAAKTKTEVKAAAKAKTKPAPKTESRIKGTLKSAKKVSPVEPGDDRFPDTVVFEARMGGPVNPAPSREEMREMIDAHPEPEDE